MIKSSNLVYSGTLYIESEKKKSVKHNTGSIYLFKLIASVLCRENYSSAKLPTYVMLYNNTVDNIINDPVVQHHRSYELLNRTVDIVGYSSTSINSDIESNFITTIYQSMLTQTLNTPSKVTLALISADKNEILAAVEFDTDIYTIIRSGSQAQLKWVLTISNSCGCENS